MSVLHAATMAGFSECTGHKWLKRFRTEGEAAVRIAADLGVPRSAVGFWLRKARTSRPDSLPEKEPPNRYEHKVPGDLLYLDMKKLANYTEVGHRAH